MCGLVGKMGQCYEGRFCCFEFPFNADLETLVAKDNNGLHYARLVAASMAAVTV